VSLTPRCLPRIASCLPAAIIALALACPGAAAQVPAAPICPDADLLPAAEDLPQAEAGTLCLINAERALRSRSPLRSQSQLSQAANDFSAQMVRERFFAHTSPEGTTLRERIAATGYLRPAAVWALGENLAWGSGPLATPRNIVQAWMASPPHRANLLDPEFNRAGIGITAGLPDGTSHGATYTLDLGTRTLRRHTRH
jgi:uncharacterized protein YkwD